MNKIRLNVKHYLRGLRLRKSGQTLVEYALILGVISIVSVVVMNSLGEKVKVVFSTINSKLDCVSPSGS
jgi:Flp pilus assembly pilin Flp